MAGAEPGQTYRASIASCLDVPIGSVFEFWKGRVALTAALRAIRVGEGDSVVVPGLTCVAVANSVIYEGASPLYADIREDTLTVDPRSVASRLADRTRAIVIQNTFGLSADVEELVQLARARGVVSIEDCTHGFGGSIGGRKNGTLADLSFFSTQWSKPYSTGLGGFLVCNRPELLPRIVEVCRGLLPPTRKEKAALLLTLRARDAFLTDRNYWMIRRLYRRLSLLGIVNGSSSREELTTVRPPRRYFMAASTVQSSVGTVRLRAFLSSEAALRKKNGLEIAAVLRDMGKWQPSAGHDANNAFLKVPLLTSNRAQLFDAAEKARVRLSDWFLSPIHPIINGQERWGIDPVTIPVAVRLSSLLAAIDTDQRDMGRLFAFLQSQRGILI